MSLSNLHNRAHSELSSVSPGRESPLDIRHLIINPGKAHSAQANGLSIVARTLAEEQMHAGHNVTVYYLCENTNYQEGILSDAFSCVLSLRGTKIGGRTIRLDSQIIDTLTANATKDTIFHIHRGRDPLLVSLTGEFRRRGIAYAMTIHGLYSHIFDQRNHAIKRLSALYLRLIERRVLESARFVQVLTPAERDIVRRVAPKAKCELIPNAAYSSRLDDLPRDFVRHSPSAQFPRFGYCGRYAIEHKGLDLLLVGFAAYRRGGGRGTLELIGSGLARDQLIASAKALAIDDYVEIGGPRFGDEKARALQSWDYFISSSRFEGMPMAVLDAAIIGLPIIASVPTGFQEYITRFRSGICIDDLTPQALAEALLKAERIDAAEWLRMSMASFQMAIAIGDWTAIAKRLVDLYRHP